MSRLEREVVVLFMALLFCTACGERTIGSVPALERRMFTELDSIPCVRLLNVTGGIGCSNPGHGMVEAALQRVTSAGASITLGGARAVVLPYAQLDTYLVRLEAEELLRRRTKGIIVEWGPPPPQGVSHDHAAPGVEWVQYADKEYAWNPLGTGTNWRKYDFPIFLLSSNSSTEEVVKRANSNEERDFKHPLYSAQFVLPMTPVYLDTPNSGTCLRAGTCQPIAGYSVWAALPPISPVVLVNAPDDVASSTSSPPPPPPPPQVPPGDDMGIILVLCQLDGVSFFHDLVVSAESSMSGLVAMLAAAQALARLNDTSAWSRRVVFLALAADTWGLAGTHRFLSELYGGGASVAGIGKDQIEMVIEVGSVGRSVHADNQTMQFFVHRDHRQRSSKAANSILAAFTAAAQSLASTSSTAGSGGIVAGTGEDAGGRVGELSVPVVKVSPANVANPGLPPSSLRGFLYVNESLPGVLLADFDSSYANKLADSVYDDDDNINPVSIIGAASLLARALLILADPTSFTPVRATDGRDFPTPLPTEWADSVADPALIDSLLGCFVRASPGMGCPFIERYTTYSQTGLANHYASIRYRPLNESRSEAFWNAFSLSTTTRFVWSFLAAVTSREEKGVVRGSEWDPPSRPLAKGVDGGCWTGRPCAGAGEVCVGWRRNLFGACRNTTARYVPAFSPRLHYVDDTWRLVADASVIPWPEEPIWTESNWPYGLALSLLLRDSEHLEGLLLLAGLLMTIGTGAVVVYLRWAYMREKKRV